LLGLCRENVAQLIRDAAVAAERATLTGDQSESLAQRVTDRLPDAARQRAGSRLSESSAETLAPILAEALSLSELMVTAGRMLALDFELAFFVEPENPTT
jgi:hypothetical protein